MRLYFLDLPIDVLSMILTPLLVSESAIQLCTCTGAPADVSANVLRVLLIHPAVHAIASPLFYEGNVFVLDTGGQHGPHVRRCLEAAAEKDDAFVMKPRRDVLLERAALRRVRRLEVRVDKLRAWVDWLIVPLLEDMTLRGSLSELTLIVPGPPAGEPDAAEAVFARPPMTGLLRVLADPYLCLARLRIHPSRRIGSSRLDDTKDTEVDWRAVLQRSDPEGRDRVVGL